MTFVFVVRTKQSIILSTAVYSNNFVNWCKSFSSEQRSYDPASKKWSFDLDQIEEKMFLVLLNMQCDIEKWSVIMDDDMIKPREIKLTAFMESRYLRILNPIPRSIYDEFMQHMDLPIIKYYNMSKRLAEMKQRGWKLLVNPLARNILYKNQDLINEKVEFGLAKPMYPFQEFNAKFLINGGLEASEAGLGKCVFGDTYIFTSQGMKMIKHIFDENVSEDDACLDEVQFPYGDDIETFDFKEFRDGESSHLYRKNDTPIIDVKSYHGYGIGATPHHRIIIMNVQGDLEWKHMTDLEFGDKVAIRVGSNKFSKQFVGRDKLEGQYQAVDHVATSITIPSVLNDEFAYLIGLLIGDGGLTTKNSVMFTNKHINLITIFKNSINKLFALKTHITIPKGIYHCKVHSVNLYNYLSSIGMSMDYSYNKTIPQVILDSPKSVVVACISGMFDTDGSFEQDSVVYGTSSKDLAEQLHLILLNFGIISKISTKKTTHKLHYRVRILNDYLILFSEIIQLNHGGKLMKLQQLLNRSRNTNKNVIPNLANKLKAMWMSIPFVIRESNDMLGHMKEKETFIDNFKFSVYKGYIYNQSDISPYKLKIFLNVMKIIYPDIVNHEYYSYLLWLSKGQMFFDKVESIEYGNEDVYDFTIPDTESFVGNGLINHNTIIILGVLSRHFADDNVKKVLVICIKAVMKNWGERLDEFAPHLKYTIIEGTPKKREKLWAEDTDIHIVNFELARSDIKYQRKIHKWDGVVVDECQRIKNWESKQAKAIKSLKSTYRWGSSATPVENRPQDIFSIMSWIKPDLFGRYEHFRTKYLIEEEIALKDGKTFRKLLGYKNLGELSARLSGIMVRQLATEIKAELPEIVEEVIYVEPSSDQLRYTKFIKDLLRSGEIMTISTPTAFRQVAVDPWILWESSGDIAKLIRDTLKEPSQKTSPKTIEIVQRCLAVTEEGKKVVVFAKFVKYLKKIAIALEDEKIKFVEYHGDDVDIRDEVIGGIGQNLLLEMGTSRDTSLEIFKTDPEVTVMLCSRAGSIGLDGLQSISSRIIHADQEWTEAGNDQRIGRVRRFGQKDDVVVSTTFITRETYDERVDMIVKGKGDIFKQIMAGSTEIDVGRAIIDEWIKEDD